MSTPRGRLGFDRLSERDRRAVRLGLLVLVPALFWVGAVRPWRAAWTETQDRLQAERALLARELALLDGTATPPGAADDVSTEADRVRRRLVEAPSAVLAEAQLTAELERLASGNRVLLEEIRSLEPPRSASRPESVRAIRVAVRGESDLDGVMAFLQQLEESPLLLRIAELSIQPVTERPGGNGRGRGQETAPAAVPTGVIDFAVIVEAYASQASFSGNVVPDRGGTG